MLKFFQVSDAVSQMMAKELLELRERTRWIPVAEKLPDDKGKVLIAVENELIYMGHINNKNQWCESTQDERWYGRTNEDNLDNVTHWMPLPSIPKVLPKVLHE
jgi:hypothetical protein